MRIFFLLTGLSLSLLSLVAPASAEVPDPLCIDVFPADDLNGVILAPTGTPPVGATQLTIIVRNVDCNPIPNAFVEILFTPQNGICQDAVHTATTGPDGVATITVSGGGCANGVGYAAEIRANGVTLRVYENAKSPDYDGSAGDGVVNLADLVIFAGEFVNTTGTCHDYDNSGTTDLGDLIIFAEAFTGELECTLAP